MRKLPAYLANATTRLLDGDDHIIHALTSKERLVILSYLVVKLTSVTRSSPMRWPWLIVMHRESTQSRPQPTIRLISSTPPLFVAREAS